MLYDIFKRHKSYELTVGSQVKVWIPVDMKHQKKSVTSKNCLKCDGTVYKCLHQGGEKRYQSC